MLPPALLHHGGDIAAARTRWPEWKGPWLDLSTGINPWPWRVPKLPKEMLARLPTPTERHCLLDAARHAYALPPDAGLAAVPGSEAAIHLLPRLLPPGRVCLLGPTYGGHRAGWEAAGHRVTETSEPTDADVLVFCRPNNPTGEAYSGVDLDGLAGRYRMIVVDEAYADTTPAPQLQRPGVVGLRSFGKFFGLAGLRLGFVWGDPAFTDPLEAMLGSWSLGPQALHWGTEALRDKTWHTITRNRLRRESAKLAESLTTAGLSLRGRTDFFCLVETPDAHRIADRLGQQGILVRAFTAQPTWLRIGLPPSMKARGRVIKALWAARTG